MPAGLSLKSLSSDTGGVDGRNWILSSPFSPSSIYIRPKAFPPAPGKRESIKQTGSGCRCGWKKKGPSVKVIQRATPPPAQQGATAGSPRAEPRRVTEHILPNATLTGRSERGGCASPVSLPSAALLLLLPPLLRYRRLFLNSGCKQRNSFELAGCFRILFS